MPKNENSYVTTKWLIGILILIVFAATGLIVGDTRNSVTEVRVKTEVLQEKKVDKEQYYRDMGEIKELFNKIDVKLDNLYKQKRRE